MDHWWTCADNYHALQNRRGGRVKLLSILLPETEFNHKDKVMKRPSAVLMSR